MLHKITIHPEDLKLDDHSLFLKVFDELQNKYEFLPAKMELSEEITREINVARGREICRCCDGVGMVKGFRCIGGCDGKGYLER